MGFGIDDLIDYALKWFNIFDKNNYFLYIILGSIVFLIYFLFFN